MWGFSPTGIFCAICSLSRRRLHALNPLVSHLYSIWTSPTLEYCSADAWHLDIPGHPRYYARLGIYSGIMSAVVVVSCPRDRDVEFYCLWQDAEYRRGGRISRWLPFVSSDVDQLTFVVQFRMKEWFCSNFYYLLMTVNTSSQLLSSFSKSIVIFLYFHRLLGIVCLCGFWWGRVIHADKSIAQRNVDLRFQN